MEGSLKVTPEKLIQTSREFSVIGNQMKHLTGEMLSMVKGMNSIWQGEAATAYDGRFAGLAPDMDRLYRMIQEHAQDLQEMAKQYQTAESGNMQQGTALEHSVVV